MGLDLEFQRTSSTVYAYRGETPFGQMLNDMRGSLKKTALEKSWHSEGMTKTILDAVSSFLTTTKDIEIRYDDYMQSFAERFEWELMRHAEPGQENDPELRMQAMKAVMEFEDHSAEDLKAFMDSGAYKGYQRHDMDKLEETQSRRAAQFAGTYEMVGLS